MIDIQSRISPINGYKSIYSTFLQPLVCYAFFTPSQKVSSLTRLFANLSQNSQFYETFHGDFYVPAKSLVMHDTLARLCDRRTDSRKLR